MPGALDRRPAAVVGEAAARPMGAADLPAVLGIERAAYAFPWSEGVFRDCLRVGYACRVATEGGVVRGYGILSTAANEAHLLNLCVDPSEQGRGWGGWLLRRLCDLASRLQVRRMFLEVRPSNAPAVRLYESHGFVHAGTRRGYYPASAGRREDAWVFALALGARDAEDVEMGRLRAGRR